jgi:steroid Delta-isomerase
MSSLSNTSTTETQAARIYELWDKYLREGDMIGMAAIYAEDATVQSPLVPTFFGHGKGIARGRQEVLLFLKETVERRPNEKVRWYRDGYFWNGRTLIEVIASVVR